MNKTFVIGHVCNDLSLRSTRDGTPVTNFTVAVNRVKSEETDFFNCTAWGHLAEICERYLKKGDRVAVLGRVSVSSYQTNEGKNYARLDVTVDDVEFLK